MSTYVPLALAERFHLYEYPVGDCDQVPIDPVSVLNFSVTPVIDGATEFEGGSAAPGQERMTTPDPPVPP